MAEVDKSLDTHFLADLGQPSGASHVYVFVGEVTGLITSAHAVDDDVGMRDCSSDGVFVLQFKRTEQNLTKISNNLHPHHFVMFSSVGKDHLGSILAKPKIFFANIDL